jgi:hypothetical protein
MINFLKRVLASNEELAENVPFSCLVTIDEDKKSTKSVAECSSDILVRACAYNINETELFQPFNLQDELANLAGIMLHEHTTGVKTLEGLNQKKGGSTNWYRKSYIAHFTGRFNAMLEGTSRIRSVNIHNRVLAAMYLTSRPAVISALSRLTLRPLPEFFISSHRAWLWKRTGGPQAALVRQVFVCANCLAVAVLLGLVGCSRI